MHKLLVIVPFRGDVEILNHTILSLRNSTISSMRLLVFDDRDGSLGKPAFLKDSEYVRTGGIGLPGVVEVSKNHLIEPYVSILAGDDLVDYDKFEIQLAKMQEQDLIVSFTRMQKFSKLKKRIPSLSGECRVENFSPLLLLLGPYGADGSLVMTKEFFKEKYILDEYDTFSDWCIALDSYPDQIAYINEAKLFYRQHKNQVTRSKRNQFSESRVIDSWVNRFEAIFGPSTIALETILLICAPWFRFKISNDQLNASISTINQLIRKYREGSYNQHDFSVFEGLVLRRLIFRLTIRNLFYVLKVIGELKITYIYLKLIREVFSVLFDLVTSFPAKPRSIS
jgi:hypothetical protein